MQWRKERELWWCSPRRSQLIYESLNLYRSATRGERIHEQPRAWWWRQLRKRKISTRALQRRQQLRGSVLFAILGDCYARYRWRSQVIGVPRSSEVKTTRDRIRNIEEARRYDYKIWRRKFTYFGTKKCLRFPTFFFCPRISLTIGTHSLKLHREFMELTSERFKAYGFLLIKF